MTNEQFQIGDKVELTDSLKFQFGAKRTYHQGEVIAVIGSFDEGMQIVATVLEETSLGVTRDGPRVDYVFPDQPTPVKLIARLPEREREKQEESADDEQQPVGDPDPFAPAAGEQPKKAAPTKRQAPTA